MRKVMHTLPAAIVLSLAMWFGGGLMGTGVAHAASVPPPPKAAQTSCPSGSASPYAGFGSADTGGASTTCASDQQCTSDGMGGTTCSLPNRSESQLYKMLNNDAGNIAMLDFQGGNVVEMTLVKPDKGGSKYDVTTGGQSDQQQLRQLALSKGVAFEVGTGGTPEWKLYKALKNDPASITALQFESGSVEVTPASGPKYSVTTGGDADQQALRALAVKDSISFTTDAPQPGTDTGILVLGLLLGLLFVIVIGIATYVRLHHLVLRDLLSGRRTDQTPSAPQVGVVPQGGTTMQVRPKAQPKKQAVEDPGVPAFTFADVVGQDKAKKALLKIVKLNSNPTVMRKHDARIPRGVLLAGGPGLGKTHLARALAGESGLVMFQINASQFVEMYVGVGAQRVRQLIGQAIAESERTGQLVIVYIDEIDAIGTKRQSGGQGNDERVQTLNALLGMMDGFESRGRVLFLASTNRYDDLDPALVRPGRFDERVVLKSPNHKDRVALFQYYTRSKLVGQLDFNELARKSSGLSGAAIASICNFAAVSTALEEIEGESEAVITQDLLMAEVAAEHERQPKNSVAKRLNPSENPIRMDHVIGQDGAKELCQDILDYFQAPHEFQAHNIKVPRGTLFKGGPGEGKTLLAQAVAGEAGVPFFVVSGSDFVQGIVGHGAANVRTLFEEAEANAPCLVFIDEIDAVGGRRPSQSVSGGDQERANTLNQLLTCMDGAGTKGSQVVIIAATNRPDMLDEALTRAGRFDRAVELTKPDVGARLKLFQFYMKDKQLADDVNLEFFARNTAGFSAAGIANVCNEAWLYQSRLNRAEGKSRWDVVITAKSIDEAILTETMGGSVNRVMTREELLNTAVHEIGGHACVYHVVTGGKLMARMTIIGRGQSLGHVQYMNDDKHGYTKQELLNMITSALGGRAAQDILLGTVDTGAASDFQQAYKIARSMVVDYGMSRLGVIIQLENVPLSNDKLAEIEAVTHEILDECDVRARSIISEHEHEIWYIVDAIMEKETLLGPEFQALWKEAGTLDPSKTVFVHKPKNAQAVEHPVVVAQPRRDCKDSQPKTTPVAPVRGQVIDGGKLFEQQDGKRGARGRRGLGRLMGLIGRKPEPRGVEE